LREVTIPYWLPVFTISFNLKGCSSAGASARKRKNYCNYFFDLRECWLADSGKVCGGL
jgi:hypothetical protein